MAVMLPSGVLGRVRAALKHKPRELAIVRELVRYTDLRWGISSVGRVLSEMQGVGYPRPAQSRLSSQQLGARRFAWVEVGGSSPSSPRLQGAVN